jgi:small subunit ribosomal protein S1
MTTQKRTRLSATVELEAPIVEVVKKETKETNRFLNANQSLEDFDWDTHAADCPSRMRKGNPFVKTNGNTKVFYQGADAQKWFDLYEGIMADFKAVIEPNEHHDGTIYSMSNDWAMLDVGHREMVYIDLGREPSSIRSLIEVGAKFTVRILSTKNQKGFILGSISEGMRQTIINDLKKSIETGSTAYIGTVTSMIPGGGYMVNIQGIDCFMPGSLAGANKLANFESIIGTEMYVVPVSYSHEKGTVVVSHRKYLQAMIPNEVEKLKSAAKDQTFTGEVTGSAKFGIFIEFNGCLTGMIHINDLNEEWVAKLEAKEVNPGDAIEFGIKEIISEKKIMLTQKEEVEVINPWDGLAAKYDVPVLVQGTVKATKDYGIFITIEEGIVGLLHISELEGIDTSTIKKGDPIAVTVTRIDEASRKVFLKL